MKPAVIVPTPAQPLVKGRVLAELEGIINWYARAGYGRWQGAKIAPFYCDRKMVGAFAVSPTRLANGDDDTLFKLLVTLTMYQSRRDVEIMTQQQGMEPAVANTSVDLPQIRSLTDTSPVRAPRVCRHL